jgi:hypothetical protein
MKKLTDTLTDILIIIIKFAVVITLYAYALNKVEQWKTEKQIKVTWSSLGETI